MSKNLAIATAIAAVAVSGMFGAGCTSSKAEAPKPTKLTILSDRECIPPPYASPSQHSLRRPSSDAPRPPATIKDDQAFVPPPANDGNFAPLPPSQGSEPPIFTPTADAPVPGSDAAAKADSTKPASQKKPAAPKAQRTYKVKKGDYLSVIAYMYKVSTQDLAAENDMQINEMLREGRVLKLPEGALENPRPRPAIKKKPAQPKAPASKAPEAKQANKTEAKSSSAESNVYIVQANDNLWTIVRKNKVKEADVRALNPQIKDFSRLQIGDKIRLRPDNAPSAKAGNEAPATVKADSSNVPIAPVQIEAQLPNEAPANAVAPAETDAPAPTVKPATLAPELNFNTLPLNPAPAAPTANPGNATAE